MRVKSILKLRYLSFFLAVFICNPLVKAQEKEVFGWVERVYIREAGFSINAKLDTGADTSSLHGSDIQLFKKKYQDWVRFKIRNQSGKEVTLELPIERTTLIKRHNGKESQRRPVVRLGLCLGTAFQEEDVNLVNRSNFDYSFLLGRSFLVGQAIIDPSAMFTSQATCPESKKVVPKKEKDTIK
jgi:hypothetical protein